MCELLNRTLSSTPSEWIRVLRTELPVLADEIVEELLRGTPGSSVLVNGNETHDELLRRSLEEALFAALGYRQPENQGMNGGDHCLEHESNVPQEGRHEAGPPATQKPARHTGAGPAHHDGHGATDRASAGDWREPAARPDQPRQHLFKALTDARATPQRSLAELAEDAAWPLPPAMRGVMLATPGEPQQLAAVLHDSLPGVFAGRPCLLVPSAGSDTRAWLESPLRGRLAAVGHEVPLADTASSLRWALRLLSLTTAHQGQDIRPVFVDDHLSTLMLLQDETLPEALAAQWLKPLADLTPRQSERLEVTLLAWLERGGAPEVAKALSVHPQTVRYRMRQLEKLFGSQLRDPRARFELEVTLRSRRLLAQARIVDSRQVRHSSRFMTANFTPVTARKMARINGL